MKKFKVTLKYQFPAWCDKKGYEKTITANTKKEAIREAKREWERDGYTGTAVCKGLQWVKAEEIK